MSSKNSPQRTAAPSTIALFERFEHEGPKTDAEPVQQMYADSFLVAGPGGTQIVKVADLAFAARKRQQLFDAAGCTSTRLAAILETPLDERYSLVRTEWRWRFERGAAVTDVTLPSSYLVEQSPDGPRIVCYIMHADIAAVLRARGLLPAERSQP